MEPASESWRSLTTGSPGGHLRRGSRVRWLNVQSGRREPCIDAQLRLKASGAGVIEWRDKTRSRLCKPHSGSVGLDVWHRPIRNNVLLGLSLRGEWKGPRPMPRCGHSLSTNYDGPGRHTDWYQTSDDPCGWREDGTQFAVAKEAKRCCNKSCNHLCIMQLLRQASAQGVLPAHSIRMQRAHT